MIDVPVLTLPHFLIPTPLELPRVATLGAAGFDLCAAVADPMRLPSLGRALIPTGLTCAIPLGYELQIRPRSGLALKQGVTVLNSPGTIDSDYRGEIQVLLINFGPGEALIERGMRIAQAVLAAHGQIRWQPVASLDATARGTGGFGSTGAR